MHAISTNLLQGTSGLRLVSPHICLSCVMLTRGQAVTHDAGKPARISLVFDEV